MSTVSVAADVASAIAEIEEMFPEQVQWEPDGSGGAYVSVEIDLGDRWTQSRTSVTFQIPYNYPSAPIYPYYLPADATPTEGWPQALQQVQWRDSQVIQVSLRHNSWDPTQDNAIGCVLQMQAWAREQ